MTDSNQFERNIEEKSSINHNILEVSSLFNMIDTKKTFTILGLALIAFVSLDTVILPLIAGFWRDFNVAINSLSDDFIILIQVILLYGIGFVLFLLVIKKIPRESITKEKFGFGRLFAIFTMTYPFTLLSSFIGDSVEQAASTGVTTSESFEIIITSGSVWSIISIVIVAPIVEELIFRKMLIDRTKRYGEKTAIVFSAICFGLFHMDIPQFLYATCVGCFFGYVYSRSGKIHYTMIMHAVANGISVIESLLLDNQSLVGENGMTIGTAVGIAFVILEIVFTVMGIIFFFKRAIKVRFIETSPHCIPKKQRFRTIASSWGVLLFAGICIAMTILDLLL